MDGGTDEWTNNWSAGRTLNNLHFSNLLGSHGPNKRIKELYPEFAFSLPEHEAF